MRSASDIDWLGRHGRTIAEERRPESRTQTGRRTLVKGRREFTQVLFGVFVSPDRGRNRAFFNAFEAHLEPPGERVGTIDRILGSDGKNRELAQPAPVGLNVEIAGEAGVLLDVFKAQ